MQVKVKGKVQPRRVHEGSEVENISTLSLTSALEIGGCSTPRPTRITPGKESVPIVQESGWASRPFWMSAENLVHTGIRSSDHPSRNESLYRLNYSGPQKWRSIGNYQEYTNITMRVHKNNKKNI
jgi:hypothetical protein